MKLETQKITISEEALSQEVNGETVILDLQSENYFGLDIMATRIWQLLIEHGELQQVFAALIDEFDVPENRLEKDLTKFIGQLKDAGLISIVIKSDHESSNL